MREIKFRAWSERYEKMDNDYMMSGGWENCQLDDFFNRDDGIVVMQYTGLKDKNGKEIYEGDICHVNENQTEDMSFDMLGAYGEFGVVIFNEDGCFGMKLTDTKRIMKIDDEDIEIIGNKFENPELLK